MVPADLAQPCTQADFGDLVGISQQAVSTMAQAGVLRPGAPALEWLRAYCQRLREEAAGRASTELTAERAALARAQREGVELKNARERGEFVAVSLLGDVLATASSAVAAHLDGIEGLLAKMAPDLAEDVKQAVLRAVANARNEWVRSTTRLVDLRIEELASPEGEDDGDELEAVPQ